MSCNVSQERHGRSQHKGQVHDVSQERSHRSGNRDRVRNGSRQGRRRGKSGCGGRAKRQALQESEESAQVYIHIHHISLAKFTDKVDTETKPTVSDN